MVRDTFIEVHMHVRDLLIDVDDYMHVRDILIDVDDSFVTRSFKKKIRRGRTNDSSTKSAAKSRWAGRIHRRGEAIRDVLFFMRKKIHGLTKKLINEYDIEYTEEVRQFLICFSSRAKKFVDLKRI